MERDLYAYILSYKATSISTHTLTWSVTTKKQNPLPDTNISTHTLTWSVTNPAERVRIYLNISTHTLTWSVTILVSIYHFDGKYFNSHAHVERDADALEISKDDLIDFNSHAHVERDKIKYWQ